MIKSKLPLNIYTLIKNLDIQHTNTYIFQKKIRLLEKFIILLDKKKKYSVSLIAYINLIVYINKNFLDQFIDENFVNFIFDDESARLWERIKTTELKQWKKKV